MLVQISDKEMDRKNSALKYYEKQGHEVEICNLEIGDYIFNNKVCFEFKTISDFINSINDNRVFNEAINQAETFPHHFVVIQGNEAERSKQLAISKHHRPVTIFQYIGAISSLNRYTTVIECYTPYLDEAYYRMMKQAEKSLSNKPIVKKFPKKHKNSAMNYLTYCVYGVNQKRANDIVKKLNLNNLTDLLNLKKDKLIEIDGIGPKLADKIINTIRSEL